MHNLDEAKSCYFLLSCKEEILFKSKSKSEVIGPGTIILTNNKNRRGFLCNDLYEIPIKQNLMHDLIHFLSCRKINLADKINVADYYCADFDVHDIFLKTVELSLSKVQSEREKSKFLTHVLTLLSYFFDRSNLLSYLLRTVRNITSLQVEAIIGSYPSRNWKLTDIANELCMSTSGLKRKLRDEGTCYGRILTKIRLNFARELLESKNISIVSVANQCGFSNTSYFISVFKKHYSITPSSYSKGIYCSV